ncbi:carbamoyltransferase [Paenibacillus terreus]|uniref:Carbamoyltransferase n=1 Tax=Paenibacillus terreus TaxID=1387834 RepID=A0ABV5BBE6_9BACL
MITVGLNACIVDENGHIRGVDGGGVCVFRDEEILFAITEERLSYKKYDGGFRYSLPYALEACSLTMSDVDQFVVSYYGVSLEVPDLVIDEIKGRLKLQDYQKFIVIPSHHLSHAYISFFTSGYKRALVVINDNEGQIIGPKVSSNMFENACERNSYYLAEGDTLTLLDRDFDYPNALGFGKVYNKITRYLGLGNYHNAGKTMGLTSYGSGSLLNIGDIYEEDYDGNLHCIVPDTGDTEKDIQAMFSKLGASIPMARQAKDPLRQIHADMAEYVQHQLEKWTIHRVRRLLKENGLTHVCVGGGVALNCLTNSLLLNLPEVSGVYVPPAPHDQGLCIGNALYGITEQMKEEGRKVSADFKFPLYLGKQFDITEVKLFEILEHYPNLRLYKLNNAVEEAAKLIASGNVIAWYQGRSEFGPRALGNRSILADPRDKLVINRLNLEIKKREAFRPFAPSVLLEKMEDYFEGFSGESPSMMFTAMVRPEKKALLSAITHVDGTARLQTVTKESNPKYHRLIETFGEMTGIYVLVDTSFNLDGMPIVESPSDAVQCFSKSSLDALIIGDYIIRK